MPFLYLYMALVFLLPSTALLNSPTFDAKQAARQSFMELNQVRQNPKAYAKTYKLPALLRQSAKHELTWDSTLAELAQKKAEDMASKNYFAHVDKKGKGMNHYLWQAHYPLPHFFSKQATANNVESIAANTEGPEDFIRQLIIDAGVPGLGHRRHLLGMDDSEKLKTTHIGIGIAYNPTSKYKYYCSILIVPKVAQ